MHCFRLGLCLLLIYVVPIQGSPVHNEKNIESLKGNRENKTYTLDREKTYTAAGLVDKRIDTLGRRSFKKINAKKKRGKGNKSVKEGENNKLFAWDYLAPAEEELAVDEQDEAPRETDGKTKTPLPKWYPTTNCTTSDPRQHENNAGSDRDQHDRSDNYESVNEDETNNDNNEDENKNYPEENQTENASGGSKTKNDTGGPKSVNESKEIKTYDDAIKSKNFTKEKQYMKDDDGNDEYYAVKDKTKASSNNTIENRELDKNKIVNNNKNTEEDSPDTNQDTTPKSYKIRVKQDKKDDVNDQNDATNDKTQAGSNDKIENEKLGKNKIASSNKNTEVDSPDRNQDKTPKSYNNRGPYEQPQITKYPRQFFEDA